MHLEFLVRAVLASALLAGAVRSQTVDVVPDRPVIELRRRAPIAALAGFVENRGQWPDDVRFLARTGGIEAVLLDDALVLHPMPRRTHRSRLDEALADLDRCEDPTDLSLREQPARPEPVPGPPLTIRFPDAHALEGDVVLTTAHHFLLGSGFTRDVPGYERVVFREVAPGIDVVVRTDGASFAYDLHIEPGADLGSLTCEIDGATNAEQVGDDVLTLTTSAGRVEMRLGTAWSVDDATGSRLPVAARFLLPIREGSSLHVGFAAPDRDPALPFVLDPTLDYLTYLGGSGQDFLVDMATAPDGSALLAAEAPSAPTTHGAFQPSLPGGGEDAWVGKLSPDGIVLEWATFLGGSATDTLAGMELDQDGTVVMYGSSWSTDFPVTSGGIDGVNETAPAKSDLYITRLTADGSDLVWSTLYGGPEHETAKTLALAPSGDVVIFADPVGAVPPATPGAFDEVYDDGDRFLARLSADGSRLLFQTYWRAGVNDIAFDDGENLYLVGGAGSQFTATTPGAYKEELGPGAVGGDALVAKLDATGSSVHWATFLGGDQGTDMPLAVACDPAGAVYVAGSTFAGDFPITTRDPAPNGLDGFLTKLLPRGTGLVWSRTLSACCANATTMWDLAVDAAGSPVVAGDSNSGGFPVTSDAFQPTYGGGSRDAHLTKFDGLAESLSYSTYLGGTGGDSAPLIGFDATGGLVLAMQSSSAELPTGPDAFGPDYSGGGDIVVAGFSMPKDPWRVLGGAITGTSETPNLAGAGDLTPGSLARLRIRGGAPLATALLVLDLPRAASVSAPSAVGPGLAVTGLAVSMKTDAQGALDLVLRWPSLPPGLRINAQVRIEDPGTPAGWSATNRLQLISN